MSAKSQHPSRSLPIISRSPFGGAQAISHLAAPAISLNGVVWRSVQLREIAIASSHRQIRPIRRTAQIMMGRVSEVEEEGERLQHSLLEGEGHEDRDRVNINGEARALQPYKRNLTDRRTF